LFRRVGEPPPRQQVQPGFPFALGPVLAVQFGHLSLIVALSVFRVGKRRQPRRAGGRAAGQHQQVDVRQGGEPGEVGDLVGHDRDGAELAGQYRLVDDGSDPERVILLVQPVGP
jgi:hypothetical protein